MSDFEFLQNPISKKWVILAPRRSKRTNVKTPVVVCPFCPGKEKEEEELYRVPIGSSTGTTSTTGITGRDAGWSVRVIPNKFPFTEHHEIVIHSPDHHKNFDELPFDQVELIFKTYRERFNALKKNGPHFVPLSGTSRGKYVYIFHNRGHAAGESLPHPHTQITVIPEKMCLDIAPLDMNIYRVNEEKNQKSKIKNQNYNSKFKINVILSPSTSLRVNSAKDLKRFFSRFNRDQNDTKQDVLETDSFMVFCPQTSEWPDEVWVAPKQNGNFFGAISDHQVRDFAFTISRLIQIFDMRHGYEFPFNFYISPSKNWYLRFIPRLKILGGFELGTQIIVNTQAPTETFAFIKENFWKPDNEKIKTLHQAEYRKSV